jgi:lysophospholipase L1-like esterase
MKRILQMKLPHINAVLVLCLTLTALIQAKADDAKTPLLLVLVGDSTMCEWPADGMQRGWGQFVQEYFNDDVKVINLAKSGRSTKTFIKEGLWQKALDEKPNVILIQFGHNDSHAVTNAESTRANGDYKDNLRRYVDDARVIGAIPILITPMVRRDFGPDGKLKDNLQLYADAMKQVAAEKKVPVIDLHASSRALIEPLGEKGCEDMANKPGDHTHFNEKGARAIAALVMKELPAVEPTLKSHFRKQ